MQTVLLSYAHTTSNPLPKLQEEINTIYSTLRPFQNKGTAIPIKEPLSDSQRLIKCLEENNKDLSIFLFSGHANDESIILSNEKSAFVKGIASLLNTNNCPRLKLVFLNGCSTKGMVDELLSNNIPVVIYTRQSVEDNKAAKFSTDFFECLSKGESIEKSFNYAKSLIHTDNSKINIDVTDVRALARRSELRVDENNWGCAYVDSYVFKSWKIANDKEEYINEEEFKSIIRTERQKPEYIKLNLLRETLMKLEKIKAEIKNDEKQVLDIESLCVHIENEIKNIKLTYDFPPEYLRTNNGVEYKLESPIGFGRYSDIYKAKRKEIGNDTSKEVAFKVLLEKSPFERIEERVNDAKESLIHNNIVRTIVGSFDTSLKYYVTEYIDRHNLRDFIAANKTNNNIDFQRIKLIIKQIGEALYHLHEKKRFAHMDVRPSNIVIETHRIEGKEEIKRVVLIDLDEFVRSDKKTLKPSLKSSPYLDPLIKKDFDENKFDFENCCKSDIYSLTLVLLFCLLKEDLMDQAMVKKIQQPDGLKNLITGNRLKVNKRLREFLLKGTSTNRAERFENINKFLTELDTIETDAPDKPRFHEVIWNYKTEVLLGAAAIALIFFFISWTEVDSANDRLADANKKLKSQSDSLSRINTILDVTNKKFGQFQDWHLQKDLQTQIPYVYSQDSNSSFVKKIDTIAQKVREYSNQRNEYLDSTHITDDFNFKGQISSKNKDSYNGIKGDASTIYYPGSARVSLTTQSKKGVTNLDYFNPSAKSIINKLSEYLVTEGSNYRQRGQELLNDYLIGEPDTNHIITLIYLGYLSKESDSTSFMLRYPAYEKPDATLYPLVNRPWWEDATDPENNNNEFGFTKPYVDTRENMPQPRTFWYRIKLENPSATAVIGVDFIFRPIEE